MSEPTSTGPLPGSPRPDALAEALATIARGRGKTGDPEGPHRARVATRRLDAAVWLAGWRVLRDDLRWLRRELADARDLDVVCARLPPAAKRALAGAHQEAWARARAAARSDRARGLVAAIGVVPWPSPDPRPARRLAARLVAAPLGEDPADIHLRRRLLRRLRYALEWLGRPEEGLVVLQDALGAVSDDVVLARWGVAGHLGEDAAVDVEADLAPRIAAARAAWTAHLPLLESLR